MFLEEVWRVEVHRLRRIWANICLDFRIGALHVSFREAVGLSSHDGYRVVPLIAWWLS